MSSHLLSRLHSRSAASWLRLVLAAPCLILAAASCGVATSAVAVDEPAPLTAAPTNQATPSDNPAADDSTGETEGESNGGQSASDPDTARPPAEPSPPTATSPPTTPPAVPTPESELPYLSGLEPMELLTPFRGGGERPLLAWSAVEDATSYLITVYNPDREPYWGTQVTTTETYVGGVIQIDLDAPGPRIAQGMFWTAVALDDSMLPVARSGARPIAP